MNYDARKMREYQRRRRGGPDARPSYKTLAEDASVMVAFAAGEISHGRAARALGIDILELRRRFQAMLDLARERTGAEVLYDERLETFVVSATMTEKGGAA